MQDPASLYRLETDTAIGDLSAPTLLVALGGYLDAGHTQRLLTEHLLATLDHTVVATFDLDQLIDYRARRPMMTFAQDHWVDYADPALILYRLIDDAGSPFLLLTGPEPDYQWERLVESVLTLIKALQVELTVTVHGIPMAVPHTRPISATVHATVPELRSGTPVFGTISLPGSLAALLELRLGELGRRAVGYAVHVPHYLAQADHPAAALYGLGCAREVAGLDLPDAGLHLAVADSEHAIAAELASSADAAEIVAALERQYDARHQPADQDVPIDEAELPSADQLGAELEAFLRDVGRGN
ncbi:PAC2 family protein [Gephyromycinifex aptenodytis]|uniref:PAC2 family protein n=1 Tax=Gephyromycinifex aptenodytis TaxID=2716227 RepID=UPI001444E9B1|nr:PAC2 family protein [Gephyromycinifex aptenodytis]